MQKYFQIHPQILDNCVNVIRSINQKLDTNKINESEISVDLIFPFMFFTIPNDAMFEMSKYFRLYREIIDHYNKGKRDVGELKSVVEASSDINVIGLKDYQQINKKYRKYISSGIVNSYQLATKRVFYRFDIFNLFADKYHIDNRNGIINTLKSISAFFLFDDDVYDLESDIEKRKNTILTHYIQEGGNLKFAIKEMLKPLETVKEANRKNEILIDFVTTFGKVYERT